MATSTGRPSLLRWTAVLGGVAGFLLAGCTPGDPLDARVEAGDGLALAMWQSKIEPRLTADQIATLNKALQEIRFHIMSAEKKSGHDVVEAALLEKIDGQTVRVVMREGLSWELERAQAEWAVLDDSLAKNAQMTTRPGDTDSADYLSALHERQTARLKAAADEVALTKARLAATGQLAGP